MAIEVILPALGIAQDSGKIVRWLKSAGEQVVQGELLVEIETDKATVEIEAPASGSLATLVAADAVVPVGQVIATILAPGETEPPPLAAGRTDDRPAHRAPRATVVAASVLASRIAADRGIDLGQVRASGQRVQKADVLAYLQSIEQVDGAGSAPVRLVAASPRARRLALVQGRDLATIRGSGPQGAVLAADVLALPAPETSALTRRSRQPPVGMRDAGVGTIWRAMAERTAHSWATVPHFSLVREVDASRLVAWRTHLLAHQGTHNVTYTDLLVKVVAVALRLHPRLNSTWSDGRLNLCAEINIGLAVALEDGLVVPVLHQADALSPGELARQRNTLLVRARAGKLRLQDLSGGTFTISNLGMYGVDAFHAVINEPQAAILAIGRVAERVVAYRGRPAVRHMLVLTLSCDHRAVDGLRGAQFLETVAGLIAEPLNLLERPV
ncbi:MAG TPA: dihydrolipoamide acetyltransferase family protein [Ktedonobacteraceae bacterium]|jgi:pyruvate dehydrogenase E2 component (dihydrolipoamide acetyltransferase)